MHVVILNQFFYPDISATSQLMTELAEDLVSRGAKVTALCSRQDYLGQKLSTSHEQYHGVSIVRVSGIPFDRVRLWQRLLSYISFYAAVFFSIFRVSRPDVILVLTTPPLISLLGCFAGWCRQCRVVFLMQDLYPDIAIELGVLRKGSLLVRILEYLSRLSMRSSDLVIALGRCMKQRVLDKGIASSQIAVVENWADGSLIQHIQPEENVFLDKYMLHGRFVVCYSGNMGRVHDFSSILSVAEQMKDDDSFLLLFIGEGQKKSEIVEFAETRRLQNIRFIPYCDRQDLRFSLSAGNVALICQSENMKGLVVPSKLYGVMAAGVPAVFVGPEDSEVAATIRENDCGIVVPNHDANALLEALLFLRSDPVRTAKMGANARGAFDRLFERQIVTGRYFRLLQKLCTTDS